MPRTRGGQCPSSDLGPASATHGTWSRTATAAIVAAATIATTATAAFAATAATAAATTAAATALDASAPPVGRPAEGLRLPDTATPP